MLTQLSCADTAYYSRFSLKTELQLKNKLLRVKSSMEVSEVFFHFTTFPVGWVGGWVLVLSGNKAISASKLKLMLS